MYYKNELKFFCDTLSKKHIDNQIITVKSKMSDVFSDSLASFCGTELQKKYTVSSLIPDPKANKLYSFKDSFSLSYLYLLLPDTDEGSVLFIGPYASVPFSSERISEICSKNKIEAKNRAILEKLLCGFTVIEENSTVFTMLELLCEAMWGVGCYDTVDINNEKTAPSSPIIDEFDEVMVDMKNIEARYQVENELIESVKNGQAHKAVLLLSKFSSSDFEIRTPDQLRTGKNYCIILNTLMRKAAEGGGVHPLYLDSVSSSFAKKIELVQATKEFEPFAEEIVRTYCRLVRKNSTNNYSPLVQKAIVTIDTNMASALSLSYLAQEQKVSPGYLSTVFKKETGQSVTEFIRSRRIKHAAHLLATTHMQIQSVAKYCGIPDVQYFSKTFKREMGQPPKDYRSAIKNI